jgi:hypothetical protein
MVIDELQRLTCRQRVQLRKDQAMPFEGCDLANVDGAGAGGVHGVAFLGEESKG